MAKYYEASILIPKQAALHVGEPMYKSMSTSFQDHMLSVVSMSTVSNGFTASHRPPNAILEIFITPLPTVATEIYFHECCSISKASTNAPYDSGWQVPIYLFDRFWHSRIVINFTVVGKRGIGFRHLMREHKIDLFISSTISCSFDDLALGRTTRTRSRNLPQACSFRCLVSVTPIRDTHMVLWIVRGICETQKDITKPSVVILPPRLGLGWSN